MQNTTLPKEKSVLPKQLKSHLPQKGNFSDAIIWFTWLEQTSIFTFKCAIRHPLIFFLIAEIWFYNSYGNAMDREYTK